mgnify:FL=1
MNDGNLPVVQAPLLDVRREMALAMRELTPGQRRMLKVYYDGGAQSRRKCGEPMGWNDAYTYAQFRKPEVQRVMRLYEMVAAEELGISAFSLLSRALQVFDRAMQAEAVTDKDGIETGVFQFQGAVAMKALEFLRSVARVSPEQKGGGGVKVNVGVSVGADGGSEHVDSERLRRVDGLIGRIAALGAPEPDANAGEDRSVLPAAVSVEPAGRRASVVVGADPGSAEGT